LIAQSHSSNADFGLPVLNQLPAGHANDIDGNSHRAAVAESLFKNRL
jgi:hypothetical protein